MAAGTLVLTGCVFDRVATGPTKTDKISLNLDNAQSASVEFDIAAGELNVRGGTSKLVDGRVEYNVPRWEPEVTDENTGQTARVVIKQPEHGSGGGGGNTRNHWDFAINDKVQLDFRLSCGAGEARLELGDLNLEKVNVQMGAGQVNLDLEGHPTRSYSVNIQGGVGQAVVRLPRNVGIRAEAHGGLGSIEVEGLAKHGDYYSNDLYGNSKVNVLLQVEGGIGEIRIIS